MPAFNVSWLAPVLKGHQALQLNSFLEKVSVRAKHGGGNPRDKVSTKGSQKWNGIIFCVIRPVIQM